MAIKVGGTEVVSNARELKNIATVDSTTVSTLNTALNVDPTKGTLTKTFTQNETAEITLSSNVNVGPVVSATKEIQQTGVSSKGTWDVNSTASNYTIHNTAYSVTLTPNKSALTMTLGSGSWVSTDVGKRVKGNGGDVVIASVSGSTATYFTDNGTDFTNNNAIASGSWSMEGLMSVDDATGLSVQKRSRTVSTTSNTYSTTFRLNSYTQNYDHSSDASNPVGLAVARNGGYFYVCKQNQGVKIYTTGSSFNINGSSYVGSWNVNGLGNYDIELNNNGTKIYQYIGNNYVTQWPITGTAWRPDTGTGSSASYTLTGGQTTSTPSDGGAMQFADSGKVLYLLPNAGKSNNQNETAANKVRTTQGGVPNTTGVLYYFALSTAYELSTAVYQGYKRVPHYSYASFGVSEDGKWLVNGAYNEYHAFYYPIPTAFDITTINAANEVYIDFRNYNSNNVNWGMIGSSFIGTNYYATSYNSNILLQLPWGPSFGPTTINSTVNTNPQNIYNVAVTNTSGRIDSSNFVDINSMTADESVGGATGAAALYAVSTDGRTTWSVAKGTDGVRPIVRNNSGTWQYNNNGGSVTGYVLSSASYDSVSLNHSSQSGSNTELAFNNNGTKIYVLGGTSVFEFSLTTAYDLSTASYSNSSFSVSSQDGTPTGLAFKSDGTKMYIIGFDNTSAYQYSLSSAFDISTASYDSVSFSLSSQGLRHQSLAFSSDGTKMYTGENDSDKIYQYNLSTAWNLATASYSNYSFTVSGQLSFPHGLDFSSDGTKMFIHDNGTNAVYQYSLSTAWSITSASYDSVSFSVSAQGTDNNGVVFKPDGTKMYIASSGKIDQYTTQTASYGTSATWANGTVNDELYTLQQALTTQAFNRMDKTQLDAIPDANHFPTGTSLDLMIALRVDEATASVPTSDGVTLNYDAAALNEGAVLGTDYDFFHPAANKVQIKSLAAQNLKVRVV